MSVAFLNKIIVINSTANVKLGVRLLLAY